MCARVSHRLEYELSRVQPEYPGSSKRSRKQMVRSCRLPAAHSVPRPIRLECTRQMIRIYSSAPSFHRKFIGPTADLAFDISINVLVCSPR